MGRMRAGFAVLGLVGSGLLALVLVDCAEPTQIVIEVYSDACPSTGKKEVINQTGITVGRASEIDERDPSALKEGCERAPGVGTLTIYPSGDKDDEVAIKVVAGVTSLPDRCRAPDYAGCIAHRRIMRFKPHETQRATIRLQLACLNRTCPTGTTCDNGVCKNDGDVLDDGGTRPDTPVVEAGISEGGTITEAGGDACTGCKGTCDQKTCAVDCTNGCIGEQCAAALPCDIKCPVQGKCTDISCTTNDKCTVNCGNATASCGRVTCNAKVCDVTCNGPSTCINGVVLEAGVSGDLRCIGRQSCLPNVSCSSPDCKLHCLPNTGMPSERACPEDAVNRACTGGCTQWTEPLGN